eukprot:3779408-Prymnesium_polylepis.1
MDGSSLLLRLGWDMVGPTFASSCVRAQAAERSNLAVGACAFRVQCEQHLTARPPCFNAPLLPPCHTRVRSVTEIRMHIAHRAELRMFEAE